jgi:hypothetical protein
MSREEIIEAGISRADPYGIDQPRQGQARRTKSHPRPEVCHHPAHLGRT